MLPSLPCPSCREPLTVAEDAAIQTGFATCSHCGQSVNLTEFRASTACPNSLSSDLPAKFQEDEIDAVEEDEVDPALAAPSSRSPNRLLWRIFVGSWLIVLLLLLSLSIPGYRFVRERYNPWLTEANCKRIQPNMSLEEVEAMVSKGKPCRLEDVKAIVDPIKNFRLQMVQRIDGAMDQTIASMPTFVQPLIRPPQSEITNRHAIEAQSEDVAWQARRQKAASWYQWKRGDTRLFVGVSTENKVRLVFRITDSSDVQKAGISEVYAVYPFADMELIEQTGKSVEATLPEEKIVEAYIRSKATDPDSVEINLWGPHDLKGELASVPGYHLVGERRSKPVVKVRVRYWMKGADGKPQLNDRLYYLQDGEVFGSYATPQGNNWFEVLRNLERQLDLGR